MTALERVGEQRRFAAMGSLTMVPEDSPKHIDPLPGPTNADWFAGLVMAGISGIPHPWAVPAAVLFSLITAPILNSGREEWLEEVRLSLNELNRKIDSLTPEALSNDKVFVAALAQATMAALRTSESEKQEALKNGVVHVAIGAVLGHGPNTVIPDPVRSDLELMFLNIIDNFTATHLQVLRHCVNPAGPTLEKFRRDHDLSDQAIVDLLARGLIRDTRSIAARGRDDGEALIIHHWEISNLGKQFLRFISKVG
jgi:uncharacterized membrane protein